MNLKKMVVAIKDLFVDKIKRRNNKKAAVTISMPLGNRLYPRDINKYDAYHQLKSDITDRPFHLDF